jgi:hypothetical protein
MNDLDWLVGARFGRLNRREYDWAISFDGEISLNVGCLWRLLEAGSIRFTSDDDGQVFGLPTPVNACAEVNSRLAAAVVESVHLRDGTLDLSLNFSTGHVLELIAVSSGYEAWNLGDHNQSFVATGGGKLRVWRGQANRSH